LEQVPGDVIVVNHHHFESTGFEVLQGGQLLLLKLVVLDGFQGDTAMAALCDPCMQNVFVDQALNGANGQL
jgi:hypothetical protein